MPHHRSSITNHHLTCHHDLLSLLLPDHSTNHFPLLPLRINLNILALVLRRNSVPVLMLEIPMIKAVKGLRLEAVLPRELI